MTYRWRPPASVNPSVAHYRLVKQVVEGELLVFCATVIEFSCLVRLILFLVLLLLINSQKMCEIKWSGKEIISFLDLYQNYPCLWDVSSPDYIKRNAKDAAFTDLLQQLEKKGLHTTLGPLKRKIKSLRDTYRNELYKIKKSKKSGVGADDVYKPRLVWFSAAQVFWQTAVAGRDSTSNLVSVFLKFWLTHILK